MKSARCGRVTTLARQGAGLAVVIDGPQLYGGRAGRPVEHHAKAKSGILAGLRSDGKVPATISAGAAARWFATERVRSW